MFTINIFRNVYAIAKQEWKSLMLKFNVTVNKQNNLSQLAEIFIPII